MKNDFIVFGQPVIGEDEINEVVATLRSGWVGTGPRVTAFEQQFAAFKNVDEARVAAVSSCSAALHLSLIAAGIGPGDEVITTALTFCATINSILHTGAVPILADIDPKTMNIDPDEIEKKLSPRTKALLPVHFAGLPCDMERILAIARRHDLLVIEDCAHAIEANYRGKPTGTLGDYAAFSFYVTKNVTAAEGGMVLAADSAPIGRIRSLALHGMSKDAWQRFSEAGSRHYAVVECGYKYNMTDIQAAIGIHQLKRVESGWVRRQTIWRRYQVAFRDLPVTCPSEPPADVRHAYHLYTLLIDEQGCGIARDAFIDRMTALGIGVGVHYLALPEHPYYRHHLGWRPEDTPHATAVGRQTVSLPLTAHLSDAQVERVISAVCHILRKVNSSAVAAEAALPTDRSECDR